jgi:osmotically-inducible protein OsmY
MTISKGNPEQLVRAGDGILSDIWDALRKEETIYSLDLSGLSIRVQNGEVYLDGYLKEEDQPLVESTTQSVLGVVEVHNRLRTNDGILADIWDALWKVDTFRSLDLGSLSINVKDGEVYLDGHLAQENNQPLIESIVRSVVGVVAVHIHLVLDRDLIIQVAQALARDKRTRPYLLPVDAFHGWMHIGGEVPTCELQHVVEKIAGGVSGVRGVTILPRIAGEKPTVPHRPVQPHIGAVVYGKDGEVGVVTQVVIQPEDRLVTHIVVRSKELMGGKLVARETVIPLDARDLVKNESVILQRHGPSMDAFPVLDPDEYPLTESTWKAPYPYTAGEVRWSLRQLYEAPNTAPATSLEPASSELKADGTRMNSALVSG